MVVPFFCLVGAQCGGGRGGAGGSRDGASGSDGGIPAGNGQETFLFKMESAEGVQSNPPQITVFTLAQPSYITRVWTYHYNATIGVKIPTVAFRNTATGALSGPWQQVGYKSFAGTLGATASDPGNIPGPPDNYWMAYPGVTVPAGTYQVIDSDPATWSYTSDLGNRGVTWVYGWAGSGPAIVPTDAALDVRIDAPVADGGAPTVGYVDNRGNKGTITLGQTVAAISQTVPTSGGTITYSKPGDPLDGLQLTVPAGAYAASTTFSVSYAPIVGQDFGSLLNPLTPMIKVDNGGAFADEIIDVKVPVTVSDGFFAMAFTYDESTRTLEGLPTVTQDANSLTFATRHFSDFFITQVADALLKPDVDSDFRPGIDDWQFVNRGSYIATGGHCTGQSMTAMWYYITQPDGADLTLFGRYDNNGEQPPTPNFQDDDSLGYRFASVVWKDMDWDSWARKFTEKFVYQQDINTWRLFAYSMQLTGEPQMTEIWDTVNGGGHAMVVYRIMDGNLYIADPNYPANTDRRMEYADEEFSPYESGLDAIEIAKGNSKTFDKITYVAKSSLINWNDLTTFWKQVKNKTIGNGIFPAYQITWNDSNKQSHVLNDGYVSTSELIDINVAMSMVGSVTVYRDGIALHYDSSGNYTLLPGTNKLGMDVYADVQRTDSKGNMVTVSKYVDFEYINVIYNPPSQTGNCHFVSGEPTGVTLALATTKCSKSSTLSLCFTPSAGGSIQKSSLAGCDEFVDNYDLSGTYSCNTVNLAYTFTDDSAADYPGCSLTSTVTRTMVYGGTIALTWDPTSSAFTVNSNSGTFSSKYESSTCSATFPTCSSTDLQVSSAK